MLYSKVMWSQKYQNIKCDRFLKKISEWDDRINFITVCVIEIMQLFWDTSKRWLWIGRHMQMISDPTNHFAQWLSSQDKLLILHSGQQVSFQ